MTADAAIRMTGVAKSFGAFRALDGVDLEVASGTVHGLLGPNGAGKTTAVRILSTLLRPDAGDASIAGCSVIDDPHSARSRLGLSGQYAAVDDKLTGEENLTLVGQLYGMRLSRARERARELLQHFRLDGVPRGRRLADYSGGMRRRLDLAGAIVARPPVVILDEPTTGLDPRGRRDTWEAVRLLRDDGAAVLLTTQYLEEADALADRIAVIDRGRVIAEGTAAELKATAGGARIDLTVPDRASARGAESALRIAGLRPRTGEQDQRLSVPAEHGAETLSAVLDLLRRAGIEVTAASLGQPTLDDVFLSITEAPTGARSREPEVSR